MSQTKELHRTITRSDTKESLFSSGESFYALESPLIENEGEITEETGARIMQWLDDSNDLQGTEPNSTIIGMAHNGR